MIKPAERYCDFCKLLIEPGRAYAKLQLPIPPALRQEIIAHYRQVPSQPSLPSAVAAMFGGDAEIGNMYELEICTACAFGILPAAGQTMIDQIREGLQRELDVQRRRTESAADLDEELRTAERRR